MAADWGDLILKLFRRDSMAGMDLVNDETHEIVRMSNSKLTDLLSTPLLHSYDTMIERPISPHSLEAIDIS